MTILLPFNEAGQWLRGSLHCHSTNSDGEVPPEQVVARYKAEGYDFICVTDHFRPEFNYPITDFRAFRRIESAALQRGEDGCLRAL